MKKLTTEERQNMIEHVGAFATTRIEMLNDNINQLAKYLGLVKQFDTDSWRYIPAPPKEEREQL